jgi:acyl-CoA reductase-like NAD-dependent aldehyde dehydrogenase
MELGGHAPVIVCDDIDPLAAAATSVAGKSRNAGQVCVSPTRFFVQESVYDKFATAFAEKAAQNANRLADDVEAGNLSINHFVASVAETPFGGVKDSGYGREGGTEGLQCYTVTKNVSHKMI